MLTVAPGGAPRIASPRASGRSSSSAAMVLITAVLASTIMGLYLWRSLTWFRRHWNEAFSALRIKDYKGFLRLYLDSTGTLTVFPIALDTVPKGGEGELTARLIEPPIRLP